MRKTLCGLGAGVLYVTSLSHVVFLEGSCLFNFVIKDLTLLGALTGSVHKIIKYIFFGFGRGLYPCVCSVFLFDSVIVTCLFNRWD